MQEKRRFQFRDLIAIPRLSDPVVHPRGDTAVFVRADHDPDENRVSRTLVALDLADGSQRELTPGNHNDTSPRWSPDGRFLAFVSDRGGSEQLWLLPFTDGGEARAVTSGDGGVSAPTWAPDGRRIAFARSVHVQQTGEAAGETLTPVRGGADHGAGPTQPARDSAPPAQTDPVTRSAGAPEPGVAGQDAQQSDSARQREARRRAQAYGLRNQHSSARVEDGLLFRHWNRWRDAKRSHLFIVDTETGALRELTRGNTDVPPVSLGGEQDFVFSPDGREIAFVQNPDSVVATSTNNCVYLQSLSGIDPAGEPQRVTESEAMELEPRYSPDGRRLAFLAAATPRYEADRLRICVYDRERGGVTKLTEHFDRSAAEYLWRNDSEILFLAEDRGYASLYGVSSDAAVGTKAGTDAGGGGAAAEAGASTAGSGAADAPVTQYTSGVTQSQLRLVSEDTVLVARESTERPPELTRLELSSGRTPSLEKGPGYPPAFDQDPRTLTGFGARIGQEVETQAAEPFWFRGADDDWVHGFLLRPPHFNPSQRYPLLVIIHGGPQSAFLDEFHYRWSAQAFAAPGYVVLLMNPRGSTGYGQRFTEQISEDWTGRCVTDIHAGIDHVLEHYSFVDGSRIGAAGASFGGFMVNWLAGHSDRFRVFVSHDGEFNIETMGYTTDELWFDRWEHGGAPHENPEHVRAISPHRAADRLAAPTLVIHGAKDYRCPESEGIALHTALQLRGVPSRFLYFPDEGHFVTKPANAEVWYATVLDFVGRYL